MKFAYFVLPHIGGTYSVFKSLNAGLADYGIDVRWFGLCHEEQELSMMMRKEASLGQLLIVPPALGEAGCARLMAEAIEDNGFDGVMINVLGDTLQTNIARYLPEHILRIMIVHNITPGTYAAAKSIEHHVHATIGVSERCRTDLVERCGFSGDRTHVIGNAVDATAFSEKAQDRIRPASALRVLFVGRVEDASKGILWLREILDALPEAVSLTVVGDGPDMAKLKRRLVGHWKRVSYMGAVPPENIPSIMAEHDVLIMPSRYEGLPMTLVEAMASGCVPVASHLRGVTDTIVENGVNGFLFPVGNYTAAANAIARLAADRDLLERMSGAAREVVPRRFSIGQMASRYYDIINSLVTARPGISPPLDIEDWSTPAGLRPGLRTYVPLPIKNWLRVVRERL